MSAGRATGAVRANPGSLEAATPVHRSLQIARRTTPFLPSAPSPSEATTRALLDAPPKGKFSHGNIPSFRPTPRRARSRVSRARADLMRESAASPFAFRSVLSGRKLQPRDAVPSRRPGLRQRNFPFSSMGAAREESLEREHLFVEGREGVAKRTGRRRKDEKKMEAARKK